MGLLERIKNLVAANLNELLDRAEDPELALTQLIRDMEDDLGEARLEVAATAREERRLYEDLADHRRQAERMEGKAVLAVKQQEDDLAREALRRRRMHLRLADSVAEQWETQRASVDRLRQHLQDLELKIEEARRRKDLLIARKRLARAKKGFEVTLAEAGELETADAFERAADQVDDLEAAADALAELHEDDTGTRLEHLRREKLEQEVEADLQQIKKRLRQKPKPDHKPPG